MMGTIASLQRDSVTIDDIGDALHRWHHCNVGCIAIVDIIATLLPSVIVDTIALIVDTIATCIAIVDRCH